MMVLIQHLKILQYTVKDLNDEAPVFTSNAAVTIDENETAVTTLDNN